MNKELHIGDRMKRIRLWKEWTLKETAAGITSITNLKNVESKKYHPNPKWLIKLEKKFNLHAGFLMNWKEEDPNTRFILQQIFYHNILDIHRAEILIHLIKENYQQFLTSLKNETIFLLLYCIYCYKIGENRKAKNILRKHLLINEMEEAYSENKDPLLRHSWLCLKGLQYNVDCCYDKSLYMLKKVSSLSKNVGVKAALHFEIALILKKIGKTYEMMVEARKARKMYETLGKYHANEAEVLIFLSIQLIKMNHLEEAKENIGKAGELIKETNSKETMTGVLFTKGLIQTYHQNYDEAVENLLLALDMQREHHNKAFILEIYKAIKDIYLLQNKKIENYQLMENAIAEKDDDIYKREVLIAFYDFILTQDRSNKMIHELENAVCFFEKENPLILTPDIYNSLGDYYFNRKKYKQAAIFFKKGHQM
ncbi:helix-turn-helix domain-containing protein [Gracilibacillus xinjiangensis]|uniref:Helix-turn-helix domain-containing protein n=1 Tax=Gracilibacillus xinjiangensis TaxID=1193282 RepID=A0ABV8WV76_9BACI